MKNLIFILAMMLISINLYSSPPDSCLKMIWNNDYHYDPELGHIGCYNPDSVRVDSCIGSPTFGILFAKKYFDLQFHPNYYPFDTVLKPNTIKRVSDISNSKADFKIILQQLEAQFGTVYFLGRPDEEIDSIFYGNPGCRLFFADYQDIDKILETFSLSIDTLKWMDYGNRAKIPASVNDSTKEEILLTVFPNPVRNVLELKAFNNITNEQINIYNLYGQIIFSSEFNELINVTNLSKGLYFLKIGNKSYKFIKE